MRKPPERAEHQGDDQRDQRAVVKIVIPQRIQAVSTLFDGMHQPDILWFIFSDDVNGPFACRLPGALRQRCQNMFT